MRRASSARSSIGPRLFDSPQSRSIESARPKCLTVDSTPFRGPSVSLSLPPAARERARAAIDLRIDVGRDQSSTTPLFFSATPARRARVCVRACVCARVSACKYARVCACVCMRIPPSVSLDRSYRSRGSFVLAATGERGHLEERISSLRRPASRWTTRPFIDGVIDVSILKRDRRRRDSDGDFRARARSRLRDRRFADVRRVSIW